MNKIMSPRFLFLVISFILCVAIYFLSWLSHNWLVLYVVVLPLIGVGIADMMQRKKAILKNFPVVGHLRYLLEMIRPELQQYFVESNLNGSPINRETRSVVYQRAKGQLQTLPFGSQRDMYQEDYEWVLHSLYPKVVSAKDLTVTFGSQKCAQPYKSKILNISAMSYGALSSNAILALNGGAKKGGFFHNTGEGGISSYHLKHGGDLVWQIGTGYFGCRTKDGGFDAERFRGNATRPEVKMIEIKLSQGAKPGHGGILPGEKVTLEVAEIRGVTVGQDVLSPPYHREFSDADGMLDFVDRLRDLSGGKPIGVKMCLGNLDEFEVMCQTMARTGQHPDFITVDGSEGGTGAAPLEFANNVGMPLRLALSHVHESLIKHGLRDRIKIIAAGKVFTAFQMITKFALGADVINSARGMMLAIGCIHALRCNTNQCPAGVATNDPNLVVGLDPVDKAERVFRYQRDTIHALTEILGAMGLDHPSQVKKNMIFCRVDSRTVLSYADIYKSA